MPRPPTALVALIHPPATLMGALDDQALYSALCSLLALALLVSLSVATVGVLRSSRPGLLIGLPIAVAATVRIAAAVLVSSSTTLSSLPGPDERGFLSEAREAASLSWTDWLFNELPDVVVNFAGGLNVELLTFQFQLLGSPGEFSLRIVQIAISVLAICLVAAGVYDQVGPRGAAIAAWVLALEPANVFYSGVLNREALVFLGEGLVLLGCVRMWHHRDLPAGGLILVGSVVALATRSYAGALLLLASGVVTLHAALRPTGAKGTRAPRLALAVGIVGALALVTAALYSSSILSKLQQEQDAYTADTSNLALEPVDFSSVGAVAVNLPRRTRDFVLRPYPWQTTNISQRLGVVGGLLCWGLIAVLVALGIRDWRGVGRRTGPILYLLLAVLVSYSLTTANAGTGFRYRTHLVLFLVAATVAAAATRMPPWAQVLPKLRPFHGQSSIRHEP